MNKRAAFFLILITAVMAAFSVSVVVAQQAPAHSTAADQKPATGQPATTAAQAAQPESRAPFPPNVRVDVTITDQGGPNGTPIKKTISVTGSRTSSVRSGVNVPVPTTSMPSAGAPVTSYNYKTMGLSLDVRSVEVRDNKIRLLLVVEYSPLDETEKNSAALATPVSYSNFSQSFDVVLEDGKPIMAAQTSDPVPSRDRKLSVELKATILK